MYTHMYVHRHTCTHTRTCYLPGRDSHKALTLQGLHISWVVLMHAGVCEPLLQQDGPLQQEQEMRWPRSGWKSQKCGGHALPLTASF